MVSNQENNMNVVSKALSNKNEAIIITHNPADKMWLSIAYDPAVSGLSVELWLNGDLFDAIIATTVPAAKKALQTLAQKAYDTEPALVYKKIVKSQAYLDTVPYTTAKNEYI